MRSVCGLGEESEAAEIGLSPGGTLKNLSERRCCPSAGAAVIAARVCSRPTQTISSSAGMLGAVMPCGSSGSASGAAIPTVKTVKEPECPHIRLLHHIFRIVVIACQLARHVIGSRQMR
jgi:hypothetical protein